jgi:hypothetical protein
MIVWTGDISKGSKISKAPSLSSASNCNGK